MTVRVYYVYICIRPNLLTILRSVLMQGIGVLILKNKNIRIYTCMYAHTSDQAHTHTHAHTDRWRERE